MKNIYGNTSGGAFASISGEEWNELYHNDRANYEELRKQCIDKAINKISVANRVKILRLQRKVDTALDGTEPLSGLNEIVKIMSRCIPREY